MIVSETKVRNDTDSTKQFQTPFTNYPLRLTKTPFSWIIFLLPLLMQ